MSKFFFILLVSLPTFIYSQDLHFSQFAKSKTTFNPALLTYQENDFSVHLQRRSQWSSVTVPFTSTILEFNIKKFLKNISLGTQFSNDMAGDSHFSTNGLNIALAKRLKTNKNNSLSIGFLTGVYQRKIDYTSLVLIENEDLGVNSIVFFDVGLAIANNYIITKQTSLVKGFTAFHLNKPTVSFSNQITKTPVKYNFYSTVIHYINNQTQIKPTAFYSFQEKEQEFLFGGDFNYLINNREEKVIVLRSQIYNRLNDAIIFGFGLKIDNFETMISYDINISSLSNASNNHGGFEFFIGYQWDFIEDKKIDKPKICPKFL